MSPFLQAFDPQEANDTLNKMSIKLSTQNLVIQDLEESAKKLTLLKQEAKECVDKQTDEIAKLDKELPVIDTKKSITLTPDQQFLLKRKGNAEKLLSQCKLFVLRADEAIASFNKTSQTLKEKKIFSKKESLIYELPNLTNYISSWWHTLNFDTIKQNVGEIHFEFIILAGYLLVILLSIIAGVWLWRLIGNTTKHVKTESDSDKAGLAALLVVKRFVIPVVILSALWVSANIIDVYLEVDTKFSILFVISIVYVLFLALSSFCLSPPQPAVSYFTISVTRAKKLYHRILILLGLCYATAICYVLFYNDRIDPILLELVSGIIFTLQSLIIFSILILIATAPTFLGKYRGIRNAISVSLIFVLAFILIAQWSGFQEFAIYLLKGTFVSLTFLFIAWFAYSLISKLLTDFAERKYQWHHRLQSYLFITEDDSLIEITLLRLFVFLSFTIGTILVLNQTWSISSEWTQQVNVAFFNGFTVAESKIAPFRIILSLLFLSLGLLFIRIVKRYLHTKVVQNAKGPQQAQIMIMGYVFVFIVVLLASITAGINLKGLALIAGALSVGIGFGLQNIVNNFVSGLVLLIERPIKPGDRIVVGDQEGYVAHIGLRSTRVNTIERSDVIVPNSELINTQVVNYMYNNKKWQIRLSIGVEYGSDIDLVKKLLLEVATSQEDILTDSRDEPQVLFMSFGDNALIFELRVVIKNVNQKYPITSDLNFAIAKIFRKNGVVLAFPQTDLHIKDAIPFHVVTHQQKKDKDESAN